MRFCEERGIIVLDGCASDWNKTITIDATYGNGERGHLQDDRGFVWLNESLGKLPSGSEE